MTPLSTVKLVLVDSILDPVQSNLVDQIKTFHAGVRKSYEHQIQYAFMAGLKLHTLKATCSHGNKKDGEGFMVLCQQHLPEISPATARRYKEFYGLVQEKLLTVGNIRPSNLLLENGDLPSKEKEQVLNAVHESADGKTWTQFYRDLNFIRQSKTKQYHAPKPASPDDAEAAARAQADDLAKNFLADFELLMQSDTWSLLTSSRQQEIEDARLTLGTFIKKNSPKKK